MNEIESKKQAAGFLLRLEAKSRKHWKPLFYFRENMIDLEHHSSYELTFCDWISSIFYS